MPLSFVIISQKALTIKPNFSQSLNNLGVVYTVQVMSHSLMRLLSDHLSYSH